MKLLSYHYHLKINLDAPISGHRFTLRCTPVSDARQRIVRSEQYVFPADFLSDSQDSWGNALIYGCCRGAHNSFEANVCGQAVAGLAEAVPSVNPARDALFCFPTELTRADDSLVKFASGLSRDPEHIMAAVHEFLEYRPGSTTVETSAAQAFAAGCGVCQDYSHIMLAILRHMGIPCRYAVGMLLGEGKSHAWVEVLHQGKWYGFDPTNCRRVLDEHIKLSHGRDYLDCTINRGLFRGTAAQTTDISVIVSEIQ